MYLLKCSCGRDLEIEPRQAGDQLQCECGQTLTAPTLRKLRELPRAESTVADRGDASWSFRAGLLTFGLLIAAGLAAGGGYVWLQEPPPPADFDPGLRDASVAESVGEMAPVEAFGVWVKVLQSVHRTGFATFRDPRSELQQRAVERSQTLRIGLLTAAGVVALVSIGAFALLPARS